MANSTGDLGLRKVPKHTQIHTDTHTGTVYCSLSQTFPRRVVRNERLDVKMRPGPALGSTRCWNEEAEGWCGGIRMPGGDELGEVEIPPLPLKPAQWGEFGEREVRWAVARGVRRGA